MQSAAGERPEYGLLHRSLHWAVAGLIVANYIVGWTMPHVGNTTPNAGLVHWHLLLGAAVFFFLVVRMAWNTVAHVPLEPGMPVWQLHLARTTHGLLYATMLVMTVLGWAGANYRGWTVTLFDAVPLPALAAKGMAWAKAAGDVHMTLGWVLLGLIVLHVAAALYHYVIMRDRVLQRMLPGI
jgi:cytochrome b561